MQNEDILYLRELARQVREIALLPVQQENKRLWQSVNDLEMLRPVLHLRDCPLHLLQFGDELTPRLDDPFLAELEMDLKLRLYEWNHLRLDRVIEPVITCRCIVEDSSYGITLEHELNFDSFIQGRQYDHAVHYQPQIFSVQDLERIKTPEIIYHKQETERRFAMMGEIFDGILTVRYEGRHHFEAYLWDDLLKWIGLGEGMEKFLLEPELMHQAADRYIAQLIDRAMQYERLGILSSNNAFVNVGNNGVGLTTQLPLPPENGIGARLSDIWGENADQILTSVSPAMSEEFAFAYESRWARLFGLHSYGCCERLDHKIDGLRRNFPNLRKISVSPFARREEAMEKIGPDYVVCFKPNSIYLAGATCEWQLLREELIDVVALSSKYQCNLEIDLKTIISLHGQPQRLWQWCDMAADIVKNA